MASRSEMPLVPIGLAYERPWRMNSWDHLVLPRPFSKVVVCFGAPLTVPSDANAESRERHRNQLAALMSEGCGRAENLLRRWRKGEKLPLVSPEAKALQATPLRQTA